MDENPYKAPVEDAAPATEREATADESDRRVIGWTLAWVLLFTLAWCAWQLIISLNR